MASLVTVCDAYLEQWAEFRRWCATLEQGVVDEPSSVPGWSLLDLVSHFVRVSETVSFAASRPSTKQPLTVSEYVASYRDVAQAIADESRVHASGFDDVLAELDRSALDASRALSDGTLEFATVVEPRRGPIRWGDFVRTRCIELAVHVDDLVRSPSVPDGPAATASCLKVATRALAQVLGERAPGRSVEVRVPPYAAIQVIDGPRHTRGTPGAVVELAPVTFMRLAAGRVSWADAVDTGDVLASGERTDLSPWLPLLG